MALELPEDWQDIKRNVVSHLRFAGALLLCVQARSRSIGDRWLSLLVRFCAPVQVTAESLLNLTGAGSLNQTTSSPTPRHARISTPGLSGPELPQPLKRPRPFRIKKVQMLSKMPQKWFDV